MKVISDKVEMIFRNDYNGKAYYRLGMSKTNKEGQFINGYIPVFFRKGVVLENKTRIRFKDAWIDFYLKDGETVVNIFVNDFEKVGESEKKESQNKQKDGWVSPKDIDIDDSELPFY